MSNKKPKFQTHLSKQVTCFDIKNQKYDVLIEVTFNDFEPIHFSYSLLDKWIKKTIVRKEIFPEEIAEMVYNQMLSVTVNEGHNIPFTVKISTVKSPEHLNVSCELTYCPK